MNIRAFFEKYFDWCPMSEMPPQKTNGLFNIFDDFLSGWRNYFITISILSIILASSILITPPPLIPAQSTPNTWKNALDQMPSVPTPIKGITVKEPDVIISEQTIVEGDNVLSFKDQTILVTGLLMFNDNSKLVLQNCTFIVPDYTGYRYEDIFHEYVSILFNDSSRLEAVDSVFVPNERFRAIGFIGDSQCILDNVVMANCSINLDENAQLNANSSRIARIYEDSITNLRVYDSVVGELYQQNRWRSHWGNIRSLDSPIAEFVDSEIGAAEIRVTNSSNCVIDGEIGYHSYWNSYHDWQITGSTMNLTLVNSKVGSYFAVDGLYSVFNISGSSSMWLIASNSMVYCNDAEIFGVSISGNSSATIVDSNLYHLGTNDAFSFSGEYFRPFSPSSMHQVLDVSGSRIEYLNLAGFSDIQFNDVFVEDAGMGKVVSSISGSVEWGNVVLNEYVPYGLYDTWALTQKYRIQTEGVERVLPGVELKLMDSSGKLVWSGLSDENGIAEFNVTYCSYYPLSEPYAYVTNYLDTWNLTGSYQNEDKTVQVSMFNTDSPIILDYSKDVFILPIDNHILLYSSLAIILILTALKLRIYLSNKKLDPFTEN